MEIVIVLWGENDTVVERLDSLLGVKVHVIRGAERVDEGNETRYTTGMKPEDRACEYVSCMTWGIRLHRD